VSTGFHAPTPGQINVRTTITTFDGDCGCQVEEGLIPTTDPRVIAVGGKPLTEEKALNYSLGFTADFFANTTLTLDVHQIEVSDRIYRTGDIEFVSTDPEVPINSITFYTNALDVKHSGLDLVVTSAFEFGSASFVDLTLAYGYNKVDVTDQKLITTQDGTVMQPVSDSNVEDIENNYPEHRWVLTANSYFGEKFNILGRVNYYGEHYDERGEINGDLNEDFGQPGEPERNNFIQQIGSTIYLDLEAGWQFNDSWRVVLGGVNVINQYIDEIGPGDDADRQVANRLSVGLQYPRRTVANYEGGSWYLKGIFNW
jgi:iron complex outermembrane receptor protein